MAELHAAQGHHQMAIKARESIANWSSEDGENTTTFQAALVELALAKAQGGCDEAPELLQDAIGRMRQCSARHWVAQEALQRTKACLLRIAAPARRVVGKRPRHSVELRVKKRRTDAGQRQAGAPARPQSSCE